MNGLILKQKYYLERIKILEKEIEKNRDESNSIENIKMEYLSKQNKIMNTLESISSELTKEKNKTLELEDMIVKIKENNNQTPN